MAETRDVIIIGGGHNGLVTAFYLAKAGFKPLVLERRAQAGGAAITEEFSPGFRCSTLAHSAGPLLPEIVSDEPSPQSMAICVTGSGPTSVAETSSTNGTRTRSAPANTIWQGWPPA